MNRVEPLKAQLNLTSAAKEAFFERMRDSQRLSSMMVFAQQRLTFPCYRQDSTLSLMITVFWIRRSVKTSMLEV
ncbi:hypothetical protein NECAME_00122 [Necator americanus]|uniref:Uncharacterized protein n=1 Tax=Necator americanus TaxID=51031 RepID=W2TZM6_NECAM|nr:hypothetical protein NECAME_00122 [Necator americanus]ETN87263.1 hypothetical protein NECAME_00122 [Necator americanus]